MAKNKISVPTVYTLTKYLKKENFLPIYFFFGEDTYSIENAQKAVEKAVQPLLTSDFDREILNGKDITIIELMDSASAFPFGSEKKLIILKDFDEIKGDKKKFTPYINSPVPSTILIITRNGNITNLEAEPYLSLHQNGYIFEAKELKGNDLTEWVVKFSLRNNKTISPENADWLISMVGENRSLIEMQLQKIFSYLGEDKEITYEIITKISSDLKEYTIFDLQNALGTRNKSKAVETAINLIDKGKEPLFIITMLTKYFAGLAQIPELEKENLSDQEKARIVGTHPYYYKNYKSAAFYYKDERLLRIVRALFNSDFTIKTTNVEPKTVILMLIAEILKTD